jgi:hypothetical protein
LMDTTWKTIPNCVSSILMLSISNVGIAVALAIGRKDDRAPLRDIPYCAPRGPRDWVAGVESRVRPGHRHPFCVP